MNIPFLQTNCPELDKAFRIAIGDIFTNIYPFQDGLLAAPKPVLIAGLGYTAPWTRDAAINTWNCAGLLLPETAKNTLLSVVNGEYRIAGEYWDAIIWAAGSWQYYLYNGDLDFLRLSYKIIQNSLAYFEDTEFDEELNLFRGAACYGDGVSAYPDLYAREGESGIVGFLHSKHLLYPKGAGIPMHTLSVNCLYYNAYVAADKMAEALGAEKRYTQKAKHMKAAINRHFWNKEKGRYNYIVDKFGGSDAVETLGESFAILFGVADEEQAKRIIENQPVTPNGVPCLFPNFARYAIDEDTFGRHSGTVWPHIQAFWAHGAAKYSTEKFSFELNCLAKNAVRDGHFAEVYHPISGKVYGGVQEWQGEIVEWKSEKRQLWSATGFIRMVLFVLAGFDFTPDGIHISPILPVDITQLELTGLIYRNMQINLHIRGTGKNVDEFTMNGRRCSPFVDCNASGAVDIYIQMSA